MGMINNGLSYWQTETAGNPLLETTVGDLLDRRASETPDQEALVYSCYPEASGTLDIRWTYQEYCDLANEVARGLMALGLQKGEHIALWATNLPEWVLLQMGAAKAGLVLVTLNPMHSATELAYALEQGDISALFFMGRIYDHNCLETVTAMVTPGLFYGSASSERLPRLRYVCLLGTPPPGKSGHLEAWRPALFREMVASGNHTSMQVLQERQMGVRPEDPAIIQYTSGTTDLPKGVVLSHRSVINNAFGFVSRGELRSTDRICIPLPFFHVSNCILTILGAICAGSTLHPILTFDPRKALQILSTEHCTQIGATPTMLILMMQQADFDQYDLSSLRTVTSDEVPMPYYLPGQVKERMGVDVTIIFGQIEASAGMTLTRSDDTFELKSSMVGIPMPHIEMKIIHLSTSEVLPCGEHGELCCRGYLVMQGYYKMPEKTDEVIDSEGWLHTGNLAAMDSRGYIHIAGRLKEIVIRSGEKIFPHEIEVFLANHPGIADVQVFGVPDPFSGEELVAVVRTHDGMKPSEDELRAYCMGQMSQHKIPRYFLFVDAYPMAASGNVQKFLLRQKAMQDLGLENTTSLKMA